MKYDEELIQDVISRPTARPQTLSQDHRPQAKTTDLKPRPRTSSQDHRVKPRPQTSSQDHRVKPRPQSQAKTTDLKPRPRTSSQDHRVKPRPQSQAKTSESSQDHRPQAKTTAIVSTTDGCSALLAKSLLVLALLQSRNYNSLSYNVDLLSQQFQTCCKNNCLTVHTANVKCNLRQHSPLIGVQRMPLCNAVLSEWMMTD